jgi:hypothetical protein
MYSNTLSATKEFDSSQPASLGISATPSDELIPSTDQIQLLSPLAQSPGVHL